jgi:ATP-dependent helicase/nuclease subunit A
VQSERETNKYQRQAAEALKIASLIREALDANLSVHDKATNRLRAVAPGDIAILSRAWDPLKIYGDALEALKIPSVHTGGGSLLDAREAKDAWMLLRFLSNTADNLALASALRSPFFAVSDRVLFQFAQEGKRNISWRERMKDTALPELLRASQILNELIKASRSQPPSRLLQIADRMCGYSAVIANLPGAARREADWRGFLDLVRELERGAADIHALARRVRRFVNSEIEVPRPPLEAGDAVALMTIHAAKGLEWPIVAAPDLSRSSPSSLPAVYFDAVMGVAVKLENERGESEKPILYSLLSERRKRLEEMESRRILYVALTRARDRLILTAADEKGGGLDILLPGLEAAGIETEFISL